MKKIAVINDLSGFGKCSLTAAIPIISVLKAQCCPITTAVLSNQTGYDDYFCKDLTDELPAVIDKIKKLNPTFDGILTGFISNPKQGKIIADFIDYFKKDGTLVVVDPVMADDGAVYDCYTDECVSAIKSIAKKADIITPNLTELCILCDDDFNVVNSLTDNNKLTAVRIMCECRLVNIHIAVLDDVAECLYSYWVLHLIICCLFPAKVQYFFVTTKTNGGFYRKRFLTL